MGDTLYFPYIDVAGEKRILEEPVTEIGLYYKVGNVEGFLSSCDEIGKIIFTTMEEAEESLQKMKGEE